LAFVKSNEKIPPRSLVVGLPAKVIRQLTEDEIDWKSNGTAVYQQLAQRSRKTMRETEPLHEVEANRRRVEPIEFEPLFKTRPR